MKGEKVYRFSQKTILLAKEKHGTRYFHTPTIEVLDKVCQKLFKERLKEGWYSQNTLSFDSLIIFNKELLYRQKVLVELLKVDYGTDPNLSDSFKSLLKKCRKIDLEHNPSRAECEGRDHVFIDFLKKDIERIENELKGHRNEQAFISEFKTAMSNLKILLCNGLPQTFSLLAGRHNHEYEQIQIEEMG
jgi:hypothetical protein